jgi:hypothetical protein
MAVVDLYLTQKDSERLNTPDTRHRMQGISTNTGSSVVSVMMWQLLLGLELTVIGQNVC